MAPELLARKRCRGMLAALYAHWGLSATYDGWRGDVVARHFFADLGDRSMSEETDGTLRRLNVR